jgi:hypothetical protein
MQWVQHSNQNSIDDLINVRHEASRHFREKKKEYLKSKINEIDTTSKIKIIGDMYRNKSYFKKGCDPGTNIIKDEKGDLVTHFKARWGNLFFKFLNVRGFNDERQR